MTEDAPSSAISGTGADLTIFVAPDLPSLRLDAPPVTRFSVVCAIAVIASGGRLQSLGCDGSTSPSDQHLARPSKHKSELEIFGLFPAVGLLANYR